MATISITDKIQTLKTIRNGLVNGSIKATDSLLDQLEKVGIQTSDLKKNKKVHIFLPNNNDKIA